MVSWGLERGKLLTGRASSKSCRISSSARYPHTDIPLLLAVVAKVRLENNEQVFTRHFLGIENRTQILSTGHEENGG